jgi:hypothetical protein
MASVIALIAMMGTAGAFGYFAWLSGPRRNDEGLEKITATVKKAFENKTSLSHSPERNFSVIEPVLSGEGTPVHLKVAPSPQVAPLTHGITASADPAPRDLSTSDGTASPPSANAKVTVPASPAASTLLAQLRRHRLMFPPLREPRPIQA